MAPDEPAKASVYFPLSCSHLAYSFNRRGELRTALVTGGNRLVLQKQGERIAESDHLRDYFGSRSHSRDTLDGANVSCITLCDFASDMICAVVATLDGILVFELDDADWLLPLPRDEDSTGGDTARQDAEDGNQSKASETHPCSPNKQPHDAAGQPQLPRRWTCNHSSHGSLAALGTRAAAMPNESNLDNHYSMDRSSNSSSSHPRRTAAMSPSAPSHATTGNTSHWSTMHGSSLATHPASPHDRPSSSTTPSGSTNGYASPSAAPPPPPHPRIGTTAAATSTNGVRSSLSSSLLRAEHVVAQTANGLAAMYAHNTAECLRWRCLAAWTQEPPPHSELHQHKCEPGHGWGSRAVRAMQFVTRHTLCVMYGDEVVLLQQSECCPHTHAVASMQPTSHRRIRYDDGLVLVWRSVGDYTGLAVCPLTRHVALVLHTSTVVVFACTELSLPRCDRHAKEAAGVSTTSAATPPRAMVMRRCDQAPHHHDTVSETVHASASSPVLVHTEHARPRISSADSPHDHTPSTNVPLVEVPLARRGLTRCLGPAYCITHVQWHLHTSHRRLLCVTCTHLPSKMGYVLLYTIHHTPPSMPTSSSSSSSLLRVYYRDCCYALPTREPMSARAHHTSSSSSSSSLASSCSPGSSSSTNFPHERPGSSSHACTPSAYTQIILCGAIPLTYRSEHNTPGTAPSRLAPHHDTVPATPMTGMVNCTDTWGSLALPSVSEMITALVPDHVSRHASEVMCNGANHVAHVSTAYGGGGGTSSSSSSNTLEFLHLEGDGSVRTSSYQLGSQSNVSLAKQRVVGLGCVQLLAPLLTLHGKLMRVDVLPRWRSRAEQPGLGMMGDTSRKTGAASSYGESVSRSPSKRSGRQGAGHTTKRDYNKPASNSGGVYIMGSDSDQTSEDEMSEDDDDVGAGGSRTLSAAEMNRSRFYRFIGHFSSGVVALVRVNLATAQFFVDGLLALGARRVLSLCPLRVYSPGGGCECRAQARRLACGGEWYMAGLLAPCASQSNHKINPSHAECEEAAGDDGYTRATRHSLSLQSCCDTHVSHARKPTLSLNPSRLVRSESTGIPQLPRHAALVIFAHRPRASSRVCGAPSELRVRVITVAAISVWLEKNHPHIHTDIHTPYVAAPAPSMRVRVTSAEETKAEADEENHRSEDNANENTHEEETEKEALWRTLGASESASAVPPIARRRRRFLLRRGTQQEHAAATVHNDGMQTTPSRALHESLYSLFDSCLRTAWMDSKGDVWVELDMAADEPQGCSVSVVGRIEAVADTMTAPSMDRLRQYGGMSHAAHMELRGVCRDSHSFSSTSTTATTAMPMKELCTQEVQADIDEVNTASGGPTSAINQTEHAPVCTCRHACQVTITSTVVSQDTSVSCVRVSHPLLPTEKDGANAAEAAAAAAAVVVELRHAPLFFLSHPSSSSASFSSACGRAARRSVRSAKAVLCINNDMIVGVLMNDAELRLYAYGAVQSMDETALSVVLEHVIPHVTAFFLSPCGEVLVLDADTYLTRWQRCFRRTDDKEKEKGYTDTHGGVQDRHVLAPVLVTEMHHRRDHTELNQGQGQGQGDDRCMSTAGYRYVRDAVWVVGSLAAGTPTRAQVTAMEVVMAGNTDHSNNNTCALCIFATSTGDMISSIMVPLTYPTCVGGRVKTQKGRTRHAGFMRLPADESMYHPHAGGEAEHRSPSFQRLAAMARAHDPNRPDSHDDSYSCTHVGGDKADTAVPAALVDNRSISMYSGSGSVQRGVYNHEECGGAVCPYHPDVMMQLAGMGRWGVMHAVLETVARAYGARAPCGGGVPVETSEKEARDMAHALCHSRDRPIDTCPSDHRHVMHMEDRLGLETTPSHSSPPSSLLLRISHPPAQEGGHGVHGCKTTASPHRDALAHLHSSLVLLELMHILPQVTLYGLTRSEQLDVLCIVEALHHTANWARGVDEAAARFYFYHKLRTRRQGLGLAHEEWAELHDGGSGAVSLSRVGPDAERSVSRRVCHAPDVNAVSVPCCAEKGVRDAHARHFAVDPLSILAFGQAHPVGSVRSEASICFFWAAMSDSQTVLVERLFHNHTTANTAHGWSDSRSNYTTHRDPLHEPGTYHSSQQHHPSSSSSLSSSTMSDAGLTWSYVASTGVPFWLRAEGGGLRHLAERLARAQFQRTRDVTECALMFCVAGRATMLAALCKSQNNTRLHAFFSRDFRGSEVHRRAASANGYAAVSKNKPLYGAAFFVLAGDIRSAAQVIMQRVHDPVLALFVLRCAPRYECACAPAHREDHDYHHSTGNSARQSSSSLVRNSSIAGGTGNNTEKEEEEDIHWYMAQRRAERAVCGELNMWERSCLAWLSHRVEAKTDALAQLAAHPTGLPEILSVLRYARAEVSSTAARAACFLTRAHELCCVMRLSRLCLARRWHLPGCLHLSEAQVLLREACASTESGLKGAVVGAHTHAHTPAAAPAPVRKAFTAHVDTGTLDFGGFDSDSESEEEEEVVDDTNKTKQTPLTNDDATHAAVVSSESCLAWAAGTASDGVMSARVAAALWAEIHFAQRVCNTDAAMCVSAEGTGKQTGETEANVNMAPTKCVESVCAAMKKQCHNEKEEQEEDDEVWLWLTRLYLAVVHGMDIEVWEYYLSQLIAAVRPSRIRVERHHYNNDYHRDGEVAVGGGEGAEVCGTREEAMQARGSWRSEANTSALPREVGQTHLVAPCTRRGGGQRGRWWAVVVLRLVLGDMAARMRNGVLASALRRLSLRRLRRLRDALCVDEEEEAAQKKVNGHTTNTTTTSHSIVCTDTTEVMARVEPSDNSHHDMLRCVHENDAHTPSWYVALFLQCLCQRMRESATRVPATAAPPTPTPTPPPLPSAAEQPTPSRAPNDTNDHDQVEVWADHDAAELHHSLWSSLLASAAMDHDQTNSSAITHDKNNNHGTSNTIVDSTDSVLHTTREQKVSASARRGRTARATMMNSLTCATPPASSAHVLSRRLFCWFSLHECARLVRELCRRVYRDASAAQTAVSCDSHRCACASVTYCEETNTSAFANNTAAEAHHRVVSMSTHAGRRDALLHSVVAYAATRLVVLAEEGWPSAAGTVPALPNAVHREADLARAQELRHWHLCLLHVCQDHLVCDNRFLCEEGEEDEDTHSAGCCAQATPSRVRMLPLPHEATLSLPVRLADSAKYTDMLWRPRRCRGRRSGAAAAATIPRRECGWSWQMQRWLWPPRLQSQLMHDIRAAPQHMLPPSALDLLRALSHPSPHLSLSTGIHVNPSARATDDYDALDSEVDEEEEDGVLRRVELFAVQRGYTYAQLRAAVLYRVVLRPSLLRTLRGGGGGATARSPHLSTSPVRSASGTPAEEGIFFMDRLILAQSPHAMQSIGFDHSSCDSLIWSSAAGTAVSHGLRELLAADNEAALQRTLQDRNTITMLFSQGLAATQTQTQSQHVSQTQSHKHAEASWKEAYASHLAARPPLALASSGQPAPHPHLPYCLLTARDGFIDCYAFAFSHCVGSFVCPRGSRAVTRVAYSPHGYLFAAGLNDGSVAGWRFSVAAADAVPVFHYTRLCAPEAAVRGVVFADHGSALLAVVVSRMTMTASGGRVEELGGHADERTGTLAHARRRGGTAAAAASASVSTSVVAVSGSCTSPVMRSGAECANHPVRGELLLVDTAVEAGEVVVRCGLPFSPDFVVPVRAPSCVLCVSAEGYMTGYDLLCGEAVSLSECVWHDVVRAWAAGRRSCTPRCPARADEAVTRGHGGRAPPTACSSTTSPRAEEREDMTWHGMTDYLSRTRATITSVAVSAYDELVALGTSHGHALLLSFDQVSGAMEQQRRHTQGTSAGQSNSRRAPREKKDGRRSSREGRDEEEEDSGCLDSTRYGANYSILYEASPIQVSPHVHGGAAIEDLVFTPSALLAGLGDGKVVAVPLIAQVIRQAVM